MEFKEMLSRLHRSLPKVLAFDPGETTGWCVFEEGELKDFGQLTDTPVVEALIRLHKPDVIVCEDYRVYAWRTNDHSWADLKTPKLIGAIDYLASSLDIKIVYQMAGMAKGFCKDSKLKEWKFWEQTRQLKHSRDAIRHACYYLLFYKGGQ